MDDMPHMCCFLDTRDAAGTTPLKIELPGHDVAAATRPPATGSRPAEEWTHWAFVRKNTGGETLVYRDAVLWKTLPAQSPQPPPTGPVTAARFGGMVDAQQHHKGRFAGLRIYNTAQEPDEIADDMQEDQTAVASFRKSYPIDFALHNDEDERVLYITEDTTGHPMHLEVTNASGANLTLKKPDNPSASATNYHFAVRFRPGILCATGDRRGRRTNPGRAEGQRLGRRAPQGPRGRRPVPAQCPGHDAGPC